MELIPAVSGGKNRVINAEFIRLTIVDPVLPDVVYTFSSSYKEESIEGQVYNPMGGFLAVGVQQRDISVTSADTSVSLSGISTDNIYAVLGTKIKGSVLEIYRGFYNDNFVLTSVAKRFTGIVTSYSINEQLEDRDDNFTVTISASSYKTILKNRIAGRKTNAESWKHFNPTDTSMDRVQSISDVPYDFGKPPVVKASPTVSASTVNASTFVEERNSQ